MNKSDCDLGLVTHLPIASRCFIRPVLKAYPSLAAATCCHSSGGPAAGADGYRHAPRERGGRRGPDRCSGEYTAL